MVYRWAPKYLLEICPRGNGNQMYLHASAGLSGPWSGKKFMCTNGFILRYTHLHMNAHTFKYSYLMRDYVLVCIYIVCKMWWQKAMESLHGVTNF